MAAFAEPSTLVCGLYWSVVTGAVAVLGGPVPTERQRSMETISIVAHIPWRAVAVWRSEIRAKRANESTVMSWTPLARMAPRPGWKVRPR